MLDQPKLPTPNDLQSAKFSGVFIDDSGTPGHISPSVHLHPDRKTWVALLLQAEDLATIYTEMPGTLDELRKHAPSATEFHATDIYNGKGHFKAVPLSTRVAFLEFLAYLFANYRFPALVQTFSPSNVAEHERLLIRAGTIGPFDFTSPTDAGLLLLIYHVRAYIARHRASFSKPCLLVADEGRCKAGAFIPVRPFASFALHGGIFFQSSSSVLPLQLADFAAFALNRQQWLLAKRTRSELDNHILRVAGTFSSCYTNIPQIMVDPETWQSDNYDALHDADRRKKRLPPEPPPA